MGIGKKLMKVIVKVRDVVELAKKFEESPKEAMQEVISDVRQGFTQTLERIMDTEIALFLGGPDGKDNKRNGYTNRVFAFKGFGSIEVRVPRDRKGNFVSNVIPPRRHYDERIEKDIALLNLAGLSTRMLSLLSKDLLGIKVSAQEVSNSLHEIIPAAKAFLERPLGDRRFKYLFLDGTNFKVRRTTVEREPTLVVVGVDEHDCKSVLAMVGGDKESRSSWEMVFSELKERGLDASAVELGIMDGLPGLMEAFIEAFPRAKVGRCWIHKARNVFPKVPKRYQAAFKVDWDAVQYADGREQALEAYYVLKNRWSAVCGDAVDCMAKDLDALLVHYDFPKEHWNSLRTTNPIERVNKEFKRRSKPMEIVSPAALKGLLAFTAMRLEYGWQTTPLTSKKLKNLKNQPWVKTRPKNVLEIVESKLLN